MMVRPWMCCTWVRSVTPVAGQVKPSQRGAWRDNVFVERLWRSVKYEEVVCCERIVPA